MTIPRTHFEFHWVTFRRPSDDVILCFNRQHLVAGRLSSSARNPVVC